MSDTPFDNARNLLARGFAVIPVPHRQKKPAISGWQNLRIAESDLPRYFNGQAHNIGVLLGEPSGWRIDIDIDHPLALPLADEHLPPTSCTWGREGNPRSHRCYILTRPTTYQAWHPNPEKKKGKKIIELRSTGQQSIAPGSVHEGTGEAVVWFDRGEPAPIDPDVLIAAIEKLIDRLRSEQGWGTKSERCGPKHSPTSPTGEQSRESTIDDESVIELASAYLDNIPGAISGAGGHDQTYTAATAMVHGFGLDSETAFSLLRDQYNPRCSPPWSEQELRHKIKDANEKSHAKPYGWLRDGVVPPGARDPGSGKLVLSTMRTEPTAIAYVKQFHDHPDGRTLCTYADIPMEWRDNHYAAIEDATIRHRLLPWLHGSLKHHKGKDGAVQLVDFDACPRTVDQALDTIKVHTHIPANLSPPCWLGDQTGRRPALEVLPCRTINLHIPTGAIIPATPSLFTTNALDFDYIADPEPPVQWIKFLEQLWGDDLESVDLLQEFIGYSLVADTRQQKMLLIVGPRRSGKGTIARVWTSLIGAGNVAGPTISGLAASFGVQGLIGKSLAIVSDARFHGEGVPTVVERLLCISGEDSISIPRKYLDDVTLHLPTRFVFLTNELPQFRDSSAALAGRFLILRLEESFYGKEDPTLTARLLEERPGILQWALEGLKRLRERSRFVSPKSSVEAVQELEDLASPVGAFVRERCVVGPGHRISIDELFKAWNSWCQTDGRTMTPTKTTFGRDLTSAVPGVRRRRGTHQSSFYEGIDLKPLFP